MYPNPSAIIKACDSSYRRHCERKGFFGTGLYFKAVLYTVIYNDKNKYYMLYYVVPNTPKAKTRACNLRVQMMTVTEFVRTVNYKLLIVWQGTKLFESFNL